MEWYWITLIVTASFALYLVIGAVLHGLFVKWKWIEKEEIEAMRFPTYFFWSVLPLALLMVVIVKFIEERLKKISDKVKGSN